MSIKIEGRKCVVCQSYLFDDDDVVFCPECGAPHHRDCYLAVGKCNLSELHGTPNQYKYEEPEETEEEPKVTQPVTSFQQICPKCGHILTEDSRFCPYCRAELASGDGFDGEIEGCSEKEVAAVVAVNTLRYIPKFRQLSSDSKLSWNWGAFLFPHGWFAFRKMYIISALVTVLMIAASLFTVPAMQMLQQAPIQEAQSYPEAYMQSISVLMNANLATLICSFISVIINFATRIICALFADSIYKNKVIEACARVKEADDKDEAYKKYGGVNPFGFLIALSAGTMLTNIITVFLI